MKDPSEKRIYELGARILDSARQEEKQIRESRHWESLLMDWCMNNEELKHRIFRFIDVFPSLKSSASVLRHIREYFPRTEDRMPAAIRAGLMLTRPSLVTAPAITHMTRALYRRVANLFIGAATEQDAVKMLRDYDKKGYRLSIDLLGEKTVSEREADDYFQRYDRLIRTLGAERKGIEKQNVSVKLSALDPNFDPIDTEGASLRVRERLRVLLRTAIQQDVFLQIDMEDYEVRDLTLQVVRDLLDEDEFKGGAELGIVLQAYLKDASETFLRLRAWSRRLKKPLTVRLVRGAYWDTEIMKAEMLHWPVPVFRRKDETDESFEFLTRRILNEESMRLAVATHNVRSVAYAMTLAEENPARRAALEFQVLYGMGAPLLSAIKNERYSPRVYMPTGDPVTGMAYLVRRLLENVSSQSFVRQGIYDTPGAKDVLKAPDSFETDLVGTEEEAQTWQHSAPLEWHRAEIRQSFKNALAQTKSGLGRDIYPEVSGKKGRSTETRTVMSPLDLNLEVCKVRMADHEESEYAVSSAARGAGAWGALPVKERADCLRRAAEWFEAHRLELAAIVVYEVGKPWREADADIVEAMDFLNFYAYHAERIMSAQPTENLHKETNRISGIPRGVAVVIAPWNFPAAILTGMSSAALVSGNAVILKPAEQSPLIGRMVYDAYREAGIPAEAIHFLPGNGEVIGPVLTAHPQTNVVAFTGSRSAGLEILETVHRRNPEKKHITHCVVEMGGKNAAIVDDSADLDLAIPAILQSAFDFAGQKCSALSRLIVLEEIYEALTRRLIDAAGSFLIGSPENPGTKCGPVIDAEAKQRITRCADSARREGRILFEGAVQANGGYFLKPIIADSLPKESTLLSEEIFGPLLCVMKARNFSEAIELANHSDYALTGGLFSRTPSHINRAISDFKAGNLYINRNITGAIVGRQPFGGFKLSGAGSKAGSADYLREFFVVKTVTEDISRHGFAPVEGY